MTPTVLFAADPADWPVYRAPLEAAFAAAGLDVAMSDSTDNRAAVDYIIFSPGGTIADFTPFTGTKAVLNLWAGVERIVTNASLTQPLCRMVDTEMTESMVEWVVGHTLRHHLGLDTHLHGQDGIWRGDSIAPIARERPVTILGAGALGLACARALAALNFPVTVWGRSAKHLPDLRSFHGDAGLPLALAGAQIVITLLPKTSATENILNAVALAYLAPGACVINPGRGPLIDEAALIAALDSGHLRHATLDVFRTEPLPPEHPFWAHPKVTVTPHVAAQTRAGSAAKVVAENIRRGEAGLPFLHLVDRARGY